MKPFLVLFPLAVVLGIGATAARAQLTTAMPPVGPTPSTEVVADRNCAVVASSPPCQGPATCTPTPPRENAAIVVPGLDSVQNCPSWVFSGGGSLYYLKPYLQNNVAYSVTSSTTNADGTVATGLTQPTNFDWNMQPAFAVWLGANTPSGLGARVRYFQFDAASNSPALNVPSQQYNSTSSPIISVSPSPSLFNSPAGTVPQQNAGLAGLFAGPSPFIVKFPGAPSSVDRFTFSSNLKINAVDAEFTGAWMSGPLSLLGGLGARYFHMVQNYNGFLVNDNSVGAYLTESLQNNRSFQGGGPTISAQATWQPFPIDLALFASTRCSLVVGKSTNTTSGSQILSDPNGAFNPLGIPSNSTNRFSIPSSSDSNVPIVEFELGLQTGLNVWNTQFFFRAAGVNQTYFGVGNASSQNGNLSLLGFQLSLGTNY